MYKSFLSRTDLTSTNSQFKNFLELTWTNQRLLVPTNPCDTISQPAKNNIHPLTS